MLQDLRPVTRLAAEYGIAPRLLHRRRRMPSTTSQTCSQSRRQLGSPGSRLASLAAGPGTRRASADRVDSTLPVRFQASRVGVSRTSLYGRPRFLPPGTVAYHRIDALDTAPRVTDRTD